MPGEFEFLGGILLGGASGALLRQPEVDAANQNAWAWYRRAQELEQHVEFLEKVLRSKDATLREKDDELLKQTFALAGLRIELVIAKLAVAPELPPPGSSTHHMNGHDPG